MHSRAQVIVLRREWPVTDQHPVPAVGEPVVVDAGIYWLRARLPFALDHVNLWLFDDGDAWTLVDTGYGDGATRELWHGLFAGLLGGRPVRRVLVTHFHPDHFGQAGWLCARTGAELWMSRTEWLTGRALALDSTAGSVAGTEVCYRRAGMPEEITARQRDRGNSYRDGVDGEPPPVFTRLAAGDRLTLAGSAWQVLIGEGHAPEQVTLYCRERDLLLAADQILPSISPVIAAWPSQPTADPLSDFLRSLEQYRFLPETCRVLPSHGVPFHGLRARLDALVDHHERRLEHTLDACAAPVSAAQVQQALFARPLDAHQTAFALGETLAHLNYLVGQGLVARWPGRDGVLLYRKR
jgi:glyoxylase-like metal-dependent hydrolase (beta-lactamase superfamily II)